jgi:hypothetical protein
VIFYPDFQAECRVCGASPCVVVDDHIQPETELCGQHFFHDRSMIDWNEWNEEVEDTE